MRRIFWVGAVILAFSYGAKAQVVSLNKDEIGRLKALVKEDSAAAIIFRNINGNADKALKEQPQPIETIASQGLLMGDPRKMATLKALHDVDKIYQLSLSYALTGNKAYKEKASEFLKAWAKVNKPDGDPVNETKLEDLVFGYDLIRGDIAKKDRLIIDNWLERMAAAESSHASARQGRSTAVNNWNSHRIKMMTMIAYTLKNEQYEKESESEFLKQLENNLKEDGSTFDFSERDALHYHIYSVEPLLKTAIVLNRGNGKNYFSYKTSNNTSIEKAADFLVPFMTGEKQHKEFQNSRVAFDRKRAANNEKGFIVADFEPHKGIVALLPALYFDNKYSSAIVAANDSKPYTDIQVLINKARKREL